jgi:hypothetical protein
MEDKNIDMELKNENDVANQVFNNTNEWMLASSVKAYCKKMNVGDIIYYDQSRITILCL